MPVEPRADLIHALNQAYFLHVLATDPDKLIPPGKSLLSMMAHSHLHQSSTSHTQNSDSVAVLHDRVEEAVHRAFWNEVPFHHSAQ